MQSLVLLPGLLCDEEVWRDQIFALSDLATCTCLDWGSRDSIVAMAELGSSNRARESSHWPVIPWADASRFRFTELRRNA